MKIVIDISKEDYKAIKNMSVVGDMTIPYVFDAIRNGTPLPKGHGRIIDESKITSFYYHEEIAKSKAITLNWNVIDGTDAPTIIKADGGEEDG